MKIKKGEEPETSNILSFSCWRHNYRHKHERCGLQKQHNLLFFDQKIQHFPTALAKNLL